MMDKREKVLRTILSKGYSHYFSNNIITGKHQSMFAKDIEGIKLNYFRSFSFNVEESDYDALLKNDSWVPEQVEFAFRTMVGEINQSIEEIEHITSKDDKFVYIVMGMPPPNYFLGKLMTTISDPSNGSIITLEEGADTKSWMISCLWGLKISKE